VISKEDSSITIKLTINKFSFFNFDNLPKPWFRKWCILFIFNDSAITIKIVLDWIKVNRLKFFSYVLVWLTVCLLECIYNIFVVDAFNKNLYIHIFAAQYRFRWYIFVQHLFNYVKSTALLALDMEIFYVAFKRVLFGIIILIKTSNRLENAASKYWMWYCIF